MKLSYASLLALLCLGGGLAVGRWVIPASSSEAVIEEVGPQAPDSLITQSGLASSRTGPARDAAAVQLAQNIGDNAGGPFSHLEQDPFAP